MEKSTCQMLPREETFTGFPSIETFISMVQESKQRKDLAYAKHVHIHIHANGLETHQTLGNSLIPMYVKCGSIPDAQQVFHRLVSRNEYSWTSLIQGSIESGEFEHALSLYHKMQEDYVCPSRHTFLALLKDCARMKSMQRGQIVHFEIVKEGFEADSFVGSTLVDMYAKCGFLADAHEVFDELPAQDVVSWNTLISGYADHRLGEEVLICVEKMQLEGTPLSAVTYLCGLKACGSIGAIDRGQDMHTEIAKKGFERDPFIGSMLVDMYAKCGSIVEARDVFDSHCLEKMEAEDMSSNVVTYICILKAFWNTGALSRGLEIHSKILKKGLEMDSLIGNTLIDFYAKCGTMAEAQQVFDKLPVQDIVSWNTLIAGYAEHGLGDQALQCWGQMQLEGMSMSAATFVCLLNTCGSIGAIHKGQDLHVEIVKEGLERSYPVGNTLVKVYAKCGMLAEAQEVFTELSSQDVVSWNSLIAGYGAQGLTAEALNCLVEMRLKGVAPNEATFMCSLRACDNVNRVQELHGEVIKAGFERHPFVGSTLVDVHAKCGSLVEAQEVFNKMLVRNVVSWTALVAGYAEHGLVEEALSFLEQMQLEGVPLDAVTYVCSLKACCSSGAINKGREVHTKVLKEGLERDSLLGNTLVDMYAKCGSLKEAQKVFDELLVRDVVSWNAVIAGCADHGLGHEAMSCLQSMQLEGISPESVTFVHALKACGSLGSINRGQEMHLEIVKRGFDRESYTGSALVDMYAKYDLPAEAQSVFDEFPIRDIVSWTALIAGYAGYGLSKEGLNCLKLMQAEGVVPDVLTYVSILKACGSLGAIEGGRKAHDEVVKVGLERSPFIGNTLVDMYAKGSSLAEACDIFYKLPVRDDVSWNALIAGYVDSGFCEEALGCLQQMQLDAMPLNVDPWNTVIWGFANAGESEKAFSLSAQMQEQGLLPSSLTFVSILKACSNTTALDLGKRIHAQSRTLESIEMTMATALLDMYAKCGSIGVAQQILEAMPRKDIVGWTALITGYACQGKSESVFQLFKRIEQEGLQVDGITFLTILTVCSHMGLVEEAYKYFEFMSKEYGINPTIEHYNCMVDLLGRAGQLEEAVVMLEKAPFQPDRVAWSTVLGACQKWGNVKIGRRAFESAVKSDEEHAAAYVLMSSIYADDHMWEDVKRIEMMRANIQALKDPGKSWIEIGDCVHEFTGKNQNTTKRKRQRQN